MTYEVYYNDGGHCGPFAEFSDAYAHALKVLKGTRFTRIIEIRYTNDTVTGGYVPKNPRSFYVNRS